MPRPHTRSPVHTRQIIYFFPAFYLLVIVVKFHQKVAKMKFLQKIRILSKDCEKNVNFVKIWISRKGSKYRGKTRILSKVYRKNAAISLENSTHTQMSIFIIGIIFNLKWRTEQTFERLENFVAFLMTDWQSLWIFTLVRLMIFAILPFDQSASFLK